MVFGVMIGLSLIWNSGANTWEYSEKDGLVREFEDLITEYNNISGVDDWNVYVEHMDLFINKYGEWDRTERDYVIVSGDYTVSSLIDRSNKCEEIKEKMVDQQLL